MASIKPVAEGLGRGQHWHLDYIVSVPQNSSGYTQILSTIDRNTRFLVTIPLKEGQTSAQGVIEMLEERLIPVFGPPRILSVDRDSRHTSEVFKQWLHKTGIEGRWTTASAPRGDGVIERAQRTLKGFLRMAVLHPTQADWPLRLGYATYTYNSTWHGSIADTPFHAMYGYNARSALDELTPLPPGPEKLSGRALEEHQRLVLAECTEALLKASEDMVRRHPWNPEKREQLEEGDQVLVHRNAVDDPRTRLSKWYKYRPCWHGPYPVLAVDYDRDIVKVDFGSQNTIKAHPVISLRWIKRFTEDAYQRLSRPPPTVVDGVPEYEVEAILAHAKVGRKTSPKFIFNTVWKGFSALESSWEYVDSFLSGEQRPKVANKVLLAYVQKHKLKVPELDKRPAPLTG